MIQELASLEVQNFIRAHEDEDPFQISLKGAGVGRIDAKSLANQVLARKKARKKLPSWYSRPGIVYPSPLAVEQSSSEMAAKFKSSLLSGEKLVDLTGGLGVDAYYFSHEFKFVQHVERDAFISDCACHNLSLLECRNISFHQTGAEQYLETMDEVVDCIYIDPSRRKKDNSKVFLFENCEPDIIKLQHKLLQNGRQVLIKSSPLVDIKYGLKALKNVHSVYVVAVHNECKEVLFLLRESNKLEPEIRTVNLGKNYQNSFSFYLSEESGINERIGLLSRYLYESNAAIRKAGAFKVFADRYEIEKIHTNSHLYTSDRLIDNIPGRVFEIIRADTFTGKSQLKGISKANITTRNFPYDAYEVRKRYGIQEGGDLYLFFTQIHNDKRTVIFAKKVE